jgi:hypothetical protein
VVDLQVAVDEHRCPRPERSLGEPAVACDHVGGKDVVGDEPLAFAVEAPCELVEAPTGPWRQRRVVQRPGGGTRRGPRGRRRGRWLTEVAECRAWDGGERERGRLPPQDLRGRDSRACRVRIEVRYGAQACDLADSRTSAMSGCWANGWGFVTRSGGSRVASVP